MRFFLQRIRSRMQRRRDSEDEDLRLTKKAEIARKLAELEKKKEAGLGPNTIGLINKVRTLLILFLIAKVGWSLFKSFIKHLDKKRAASATSQSIEL